MLLLLYPAAALAYNGGMVEALALDDRAASLRQ